ncbi:MAG: DUF1295 domain-containing protein [Actinomycetota bacterium]|nr:DUF1295 domain-containing protein [Actinomycetota bacterium]
MNNSKGNYKIGKNNIVWDMQILNIKTRKFSFFVIALTYMLALLAAFLVFNFFKELGLIYSTLLANIAATLVVWLIGILFNNSSIYDPYWSVAPMAILISWVAVLGQPFNLTHLLFLLAIIIWGTRLTLNWAIRWRGLSHQDWRYTQLKESSIKLWFFTNLVGIHIMPTIVVYLALVPAYFALNHAGRGKQPYYIRLSFMPVRNINTGCIRSSDEPV